MSPLSFIVKEHIINTQYIREYPGATANGEEDLKLHIKQYVPKEQIEPFSKAVTIIGTHANGFPKVVILCNTAHRLTMLGII
jgi:hypothetical protein